MVMPPGGGSFIDPIRFPVAAAEALTRDLQQRAAAAALGQATPTPTPAPSGTDHAEARVEAQRIQEDPETPRKIAELAGHLIETRPSESVPIVVDVEIPSRWPGRSPVSGLAEVYRAWPIGNLEYLHKDSLMSAEWAVTPEGRIIRYERRRPSVALDSNMRWMDPQHGGPGIWTHNHPAVVLERLEAAAAASSSGASDTLVAELLVGRPLTRRESQQLNKLQHKTAHLWDEYRKYRDLYGTEEASSMQGPPSRRARQVYRRQAKLERRFGRLRKKRQALDPNIKLAASLAEATSGRRRR